MNWQIEWGTDPQVFGFDFAALLAEGIQVWLTARHCDSCGALRPTRDLRVDTGRELLHYQVCDDCHPGFQD